MPHSSRPSKFMIEDLRPARAGGEDDENAATAGDVLRVTYGAVDTSPLTHPISSSPRLDGRCCQAHDLASVGRGLVFLLVHGALAWGAALVLVFAVVFCVLLLPLCGLGLWLFRQLLFHSGLVDGVARWDAALVNFVAAKRDHIQIDTSRTVLPLSSLRWDPNPGLPSERIVSGLDTVCAESALVLVFLTTIQPLLAMIGLCIVALVVGLPLLLVHTLLTHEHVLVAPSSSSWQLICAYTAVVLVLVVAVMTVDLVVGFCTAATRFFCCERVYPVALPPTRAAVLGSGGSSGLDTATRPNVVVVRLPPTTTGAGVYTFATSSATSLSPSTARSVATAPSRVSS